MISAALRDKGCGRKSLAGDDAAIYFDLHRDRSDAGWRMNELGKLAFRMHGSLAVLGGDSKVRESLICD